MPFSASPIIAAFQRQAQRSRSIPTSTTVAPQPHPLLQTPSISHTESVLARKRPLHHVLTRADRAKIVKWIIFTSSVEGDKHLPAKAVRYFPALFRGTTNANILKVSRLLKNEAEYLNESGKIISRGCSSSITRVTKCGFKRVYPKARAGRGRKRAAWVQAVHPDLVLEFDRLRKLGVKFNMKTMKSLALHLISTSKSDAYCPSFVDPKSGNIILTMISARWIQSFCERFQIVSRALTGKLQTSPAKELFIEKEVAFHLGVLARQFRNGELDEVDVDADETHFIINLDNGRTLGFSGESEVKYTDVVSGGEGMTMVVRISGGRDAIIEALFMVFRNDLRSYPIRGVPDDVPGVAYRTRPKGWMDTVVMPEWLSERRIINPLSHERKRILYVDNCSGHNYTTPLAASADTIRTEIRYFPKNATYLVQPCDSFVIQKIKRAWTTRWEQHKMERIMCDDWTDGSGKLKNPGKSFFLRLAVAAVREVTAQRDEEGLTYARKAMIRTGMACNTNGVWEEKQLFPNLQAIIVKHRNHFDGEPVF